MSSAAECQAAAEAQAGRAGKSGRMPAGLPLQLASAHADRSVLTTRSTSYASAISCMSPYSMPLCTILT